MGIRKCSSFPNSLIHRRVHPKRHALGSRKSISTGTLHKNKAERNFTKSLMFCISLMVYLSSTWIDVLVMDMIVAAYCETWLYFYWVYIFSSYPFSSSPHLLPTASFIYLFILNSSGLEWGLNYLIPFSDFSL